MLSVDHAHSLLFYYPTDIYIDAAAYLNAEQKKRIRDWTGSGIMRASIGLENPDDLIAGLDQALNARTFIGLRRTACLPGYETGFEVRFYVSGTNSIPPASHHFFHRVFGVKQSP